VRDHVDLPGAAIATSGDASRAAEAARSDGVGVVRYGIEDDVLETATARTTGAARGRCLTTTTAAAAGIGGGAGTSGNTTARPATATAVATIAADGLGRAKEIVGETIAARDIVDVTTGCRAA
jgi:hypothetical protein